ncbi:MAG: helix-turn-helix domain-containing protein [Chloroflexota bacterium]|nr:helix-turn-helix domain-containing protein [Chloroflexota bacterium]
METLGQRLEWARRRGVMTQAELAQAAGVALVTVTRLENDAGSGNPRPETVRRLAKALDVDPAWLLFGGDPTEGKAAA